MNATQIRQPLALNEVGVEVLQRDEVGIHFIVRVPANFVRVDKGDCAREAVYNSAQCRRGMHLLLYLCSGGYVDCCWLDPGLICCVEFWSRCCRWLTASLAA